MGRFSASATRVVAIVAFVACTTQATGRSLAGIVTDNEIEIYGKGISIEGTTEQRALIRQQLDSLAKLPTGAKLLDAIEAAATDGKFVKITHSLGDASVGWASSDAHPLKYEMDGDNVRILEPGPGTVATVSYDPRYTDTNKDIVIPGGMGCMTPEVILGHELVHALHVLQGRLLNKLKYVEPNGNETNYEERVTTGLGGITDPDGFTENAFRADQSIGDRTTYARLCEIPRPKSKGILGALATGAQGTQPAQGTAQGTTASNPNPWATQQHTEQKPSVPANRTTAAERKKVLARTLNSALGE